MANDEHADGEKRTISIPDPVVVRDLAIALEMKPFVIVRDLMDQNVFVSLSMAIDFATAASLCSRYGVAANKII